MDAMIDVLCESKVGLIVHITCSFTVMQDSLALMHVGGLCLLLLHMMISRYYLLMAQQTIKPI
jgi:hypothetical protein